MLKLIVALFIVALAVAYFVDPSALQPWKEVAGQASTVTTQMVRKTGEEASEAMKKSANPGLVVDEDDVKK